MGDRARKPRTLRHHCDFCGQGFARADHLQRHRHLHTGDRPYACIFCRELFGSDSLRNHYAGCLQRGDRTIPITDQKGRRKHACQTCSTMKLRCDGNIPCKSCQKRNSPCTKVTTSDIVSPIVSTGASTKPNSSTRSSHRAADVGSIKFLLNAGEAGFTADMQLPDGSDKPRASSVARPQPPLQTVAPSIPFLQQLFDLQRSHSATSDLLQAFEDGPFQAYRQHWQDASDQLSTSFLWPLGLESDWPGCHQTSPSDGLGHVVAAALVNTMTLAIARLALDYKTQQDLNADVHFLMIPERIGRFIESYKTVWHLNCPLLHVASFDPETVEINLLIPVVLTGALYSVDDSELAAARALLDVAELYIFSHMVVSPEQEVRRSLEGRRTDPCSDWTAFQQFQGAYLMVETQYWAGNQAARNRAMECRFSEIIKVVRSLGLNKLRHTPEEQHNEELWIQKECKIRTMCILFTQDCAFIFFRSYPCRLSFTELDFEMPCEETIFNSQHPFTHPTFGTRPPVTIKEGVQALSVGTPLVPSGTRESRFTMKHMFILIHVLYAFIANRLSLPWLAAMHLGCGDLFLAKIRVTLDRWIEHWDETCSATSPEEWKMAGLSQNGHKYWMVAQLLWQKHELVEGDELMVPKCENRWARMQALA